LIRNASRAQGIARSCSGLPEEFGEAVHLDLGGEAGDERAQVAQRADGFALLWRSEQTCHPSPRMILGR